jgi:hypothetical protein
MGLRSSPLAAETSWRGLFIRQFELTIQSPSRCQAELAPRVVRVLISATGEVCRTTTSCCGCACGSKLWFPADGLSQSTTWTTDHTLQAVMAKMTLRHEGVIRNHTSTDDVPVASLLTTFDATPSFIDADACR